MNIFVVGGAGYIGCSLCSSLIELGHRVTVFDKYMPPEIILYLQNYSNFHVFQGDILVSDALDKAVEDVEVVYHLGSPSNVREGSSCSHAEEGFLGSVNLIEACIRHKVKKFIFASTSAVYGDKGLERSYEIDSTYPISAYGVSKLAVERYLYHANIVHDFCSVIFRIANVYSETMHFNRVICQFMDNLLKNRPITIYGDGSSIRDYIYLSDVIDVLVMALKNDLTNRLFNLGTGIGTRLDKLLSLCQEVTGVTDIQVRNVDFRKEDVYQIVLDNTRLKEFYDWEPKISLEYGLRKTYEKRYESER